MPRVRPEHVSHKKPERMPLCYASKVPLTTPAHVMDTTCLVTDLYSAAEVANIRMEPHLHISPAFLFSAEIRFESSFVWTVDAHGTIPRL